MRKRAKTHTHGLGGWTRGGERCSSANFDRALGFGRVQRLYVKPQSSSSSATVMSSFQKYVPPSKRNKKNATKIHQMDLMPSVSRSSGLEKGGDALVHTQIPSVLT